MRRHKSMAGLALGLGLFCLFAIGAALGASGPGGNARQRTVELIRIDGSINAAVAGFIEDSLADAVERRAQALVIELDTPGGLLSSTQRIVKDLLGAEVPVIVYVAPAGASAASGGMFVTLAAHVAAMAPGTTIGAAHPVDVGGGNVPGAMGQKLENFAASFAQSVARERGRNQAWVEKAVRESAAIGDPQALRLHVVDLVARDLNDLLTQADGRKVKVGTETRALELADATVYRRKMRPAQKLLDTLADPNLVYLLLTAGLLGLYFEFAHPGALFPGVAGAICLLLALASFEVLPVNLSGLLLLLLGVGLLVAEAHLPGYGVAGLGGLIAFVLGSLLLVDSSQTDLRVSRGLIAGAALAVAVFFICVGVLLVRGRWRKVVTGREGLIGELGEVREPIAPGLAGRIFIHGESWRAVSQDALGVGERALVAGVRGMEVEVRRPS